MKKPGSKILYGVVILWVVAASVLGLIAYFVSSFDKASGTWFDGLGRPLVPAPFLIRAVFGSDRLYPGAAWFIVDMVVFWGGFMALQLLTDRDKDPKAGSHSADEPSG
jgi:hypothetical protein